MIAVYVFREKLRSFYGRYDVFITPAVRFLLGFLAFHLINGELGYMTKVNNILVELVLALVCSVLPYGVMAFLAALMILAHVSSVSLELTAILAVLMVMVGILYYGFQPGDSYLLVLTPIFFHYNIPYAIPILAGLSGSLTSAVPVCCGTAMFYIFQYVKQNAGVLSGEASAELIQRYAQIIRSLLMNQAMIVMMATCGAGVVAVYLIRRLSVKYSWAIAVGAGVVVQLGMIFMGDFLFNVSVPMGPLVVSMILSVLLSAAYYFMVFAVDYSRTEYLQFEDDDYYYYVKAVPKISVTAPDVKVQMFNRRRKGSAREEGYME